MPEYFIRRQFGRAPDQVFSRVGFSDDHTRTLLTTPVGGDSSWTALARFLGHDIVPAPLRGADLSAWATWTALGAWLWPIPWRQVGPGLVNTLVLSQIALIGMGLLSLVLFPLACARFAGRLGQGAGRALLVWSVPRRSTCWPTCCSSSSGPPCCPR